MVSGIYIIKSVVNGKFYIGSSNNVHRRWRDHRAMLRKDAHYNAKMQNHFNKYGKDCFSFKIVEVCPIDKLIIREQHWIDLLTPPFNLCRIADRTTGITFKRSQENKDKISKALKGRKRNHKVTIYKHGDHIQSKSVVRRSEDGAIKKYPSLSSVSVDGFIPQNVHRAIRNEWQHRGFTWEYSTGRE